MISYFKKCLALIELYFRTPFFGFIQGQKNISDGDLKTINKMVGLNNQDVVNDFEENFASVIGEGRAVSFAAGRMGFFAVMYALKIGPNDEVILPAATCSVMVNAILRIGAKPIYSDIDPVTYGSSVDGIKIALSSRTKLIVAQHSFGIPCDIQPIVKLAKEHNIFLLEDSALTLGSKIDGVICGNFGDAALFSTDHSKPLNLLTGGLIYSNNEALISKLKNIQNDADDLSLEKQQGLMKQLLFERKYANPSLFGRMKIVAVFNSKFRRNFKPFLDEDFSDVPSKGYPYPAKLPVFLALLGNKMLKHWPETMETRRKLLNKIMLKIDSEMQFKNFSVYIDPSREIVPLRFAWATHNGAVVRIRLSKLIDISWIWFMQPIVGSTAPLENFGYKMDSCPHAEKIGGRMVNLPCNLDLKWHAEFLDKVSKRLGELI